MEGTDVNQPHDPPAHPPQQGYQQSALQYPPMRRPANWWVLAYLLLVFAGVYFTLLTIALIA